jgi:signal transduction histidine kinase
VSWRYLKVQEDTLQRVSRDLHDEFGQILTALGAVLARAERQASRAGGPAANGDLAQEIHHARGVVQEAQQKIRTLSQMLRPTILDDFGLERTLRWYVTEFTRSMGLAARFEQTGEIPFIPPETAIHLYRIAQEAMTNAARHARAENVTVRLGCTQDRLRMEILDDGHGFDADPAAGGVGLVSMRERAERLGGTFSILKENGCIIRVEVPRPVSVRASATGLDSDERDSTPVHRA